MTLLFAVLALVLWTFEPQVEVMPIELILASKGEEKNVTCWKNEAGAYYLFLPSYAEPASAQLRVHAREVWIDGRPAENGMPCGEFALDTPYSFSFASSEGQVSTVLTFTRSENLPALFIDTGSGTMDYIQGKKGNQEAGQMSLYTPEGELAYRGNLDAINGRGNDWLIPKKSYSLQLAVGADLLGMGLAEKWILQANAIDASHLRNKLIYDFAAELGLDYSPESQWVDLYLNGEYAGLYLLCERNELHEQRVSLQEDGAFLVSMDVSWRLQQNNKPFLTTEAGYAFRIQDSQLGDASLRRLLQSVENAVTSETGQDPLTGKHWAELIDLDSWVKKYLIEEIFGNGDGGAISQYFYGTAEEGILYAGPVWDYDVSMGNSQASRVRAPNTILAGRSRIWSNNPNLSWYYGLYRQKPFYERMVAIYRESCLPLLDTFLNVHLDAYASLIDQASAMNQLRWEVLGAYQVGVLAETENIRSYMAERIAFLNQMWLEQASLSRVLIDANDGGFTICFAVSPGAQVPFLPEYEPSPEILGWYIAGSEEPFDIEQPIYEDMEIVLRRSEPVLAEDEPAETQNGSRSIPLKYAPFVLLLGILGVVCLTDAKRQKQKNATYEEAPSGNSGSRQ